VKLLWQVLGGCSSGVTLHASTFTRDLFIRPRVDQSLGRKDTQLKSELVMVCLCAGKRRGGGTQVVKGLGPLDCTSRPRTLIPIVSLGEVVVGATRTQPVAGATPAATATSSAIRR